MKIVNVVLYLYTLIFMVKGFKIVYYCTQAANMEMTVNRECDNYMNQMFKTCENAYKVFMTLITWKFANRAKSYQKVHM